MPPGSRRKGSQAGSETDSPHLSGSYLSAVATGMPARQRRARNWTKKKKKNSFASSSPVGQSEVLKMEAGTLLLQSTSSWSDDVQDIEITGWPSPLAPGRPNSDSFAAAAAALLSSTLERTDQGERLSTSKQATQRTRCDREACTASPNASTCFANEDTNSVSEA
eukprot:CAMPEP_0206617762 /NCGR_PEP_ID=MMETSP0325_2-20121206/59822_1 /ASSEMBLY_ACC=CAM_ASM_000347 /TAXON_ID=2866 /ORGANISM="Crypthecodinium cohnii, Strain Seligo" /LENGTH=164 /DNA_ID=CAMNT_0054139795 /DNA_START=595 /DNA_END=1086 /DNA_ORIENTATION=+